MIPTAPFKNARLDIHFAVQFKDRFFDKKVKAADGSTSQPNRILRMALKQDARMRAATSNGVLGIGCRGTVGKPDCRPEKPRIRGFKKHKPRFKATATEEEEPVANAKKAPAKSAAPLPRANPADQAAERRRAAQDRRAGRRATGSASPGAGTNPGPSKLGRPQPNRGSPPPSSLRPSSATLNRPIPAPSTVNRGIRPIDPNDSAYGGGSESEGDEEEEDEDEDDEEEDEDEDDEDEDEDDEDEDEDDEEEEDDE